MTSSPTISALVTFHREGPVAANTLRGMERVRLHAEAAGVGVEFVTVLDCADAETIKIVRNCPVMRRDDIVLEVANGDPASARNSGIAVARGEYIGVFDGDDYYSDNWLTEALRVALSGQRERVVHPELQVSFGATHCIARILDMEERPDYPLQNCLAVHPWIACSFAHRSIYEAVPYAPNDTNITGFGYEDWHWNLETIAAGCRHVSAAGTVHYYRRKPASTLTYHSANGAVIRPSAFFDQPARWGLQVKSQALPAAPRAPGDDGAELVPKWVVDGFRAIAAIEPELTPTREFLARYFAYTPPFDLAPGELYQKAHAQASGADAEVICIVPWLDSEDPSQAAWRTMLAQRAAGRRVLVISTAAEDSRLNRNVPAEFRLLEFGYLSRDFTDDCKVKVLTRLILQSRASELCVLHAGLGWTAVKRHGRSFLAVGQRIYASVPSTPGQLRDGRYFSGEVTQLVQDAAVSNIARSQIDEWESLATRATAADRALPIQPPAVTAVGTPPSAPSRIVRCVRRFLSRGGHVGRST